VSKTIKEDLTKDQSKRQTINIIIDEIFNQIEQKDYVGKMEVKAIERNNLVPVIEYYIPSLEKTKTRFFIYVIPDRHMMNSTGGYSIKNNYLVTYLYIDTQLYDTALSKFGLVASIWSNMIIKILHQENYMTYMRSSLNHELEHWLDHKVDKFNFTSYQYPKSQINISHEDIKKYHFQPLEFNAYYNALILDLTNLIGKYKKKSGTEGLKSLKGLFGTTFDRFVRGLDSIMKIQPESPLKYNAEF